ncbi:hypothetical protein GCM10010471_31750 [Leucobacter komagatae]
MPQFGEVPHVGERAIGQAENLLAALKHEEACIREAGASAAARGELRADEPVEVLEVVIDRWLAPPEPGCRAGDGALGGDRAECLKLAEIDHVGSRNS